MTIANISGHAKPTWVGRRVVIASMLHPEKAYAFKEFFAWCARQTYVYHGDWFIQVHTGVYGDLKAVRRMRSNARELAIKRKADLFFIDCDTIPSDDVIYKLRKVDADIVTGIYYSRCHFLEGDGKVPLVFAEDPDTLQKDETSDITGAGMGCCLIRNKVLERIDFDWNYTPDDDWPFYHIARAKGFKTKSLNTEICKHFYEEGKWI